MKDILSIFCQALPGGGDGHSAGHPGPAVLHHLHPAGEAIGAYAHTEQCPSGHLAIPPYIGPGYESESPSEAIGEYDLYGVVYYGPLNQLLYTTWMWMIYRALLTGAVLGRDLPPGRAVQVDPGFFAVDPTLAFRDFQLLKLKHDKLLSSFAFHCNLRHYHQARSLPTAGRCSLTPGWKQLTPRLLSTIDARI